MVERVDRLFNPLDALIVACVLLIQAGVFLQVMLYPALDLVTLGFEFLERAGPFPGAAARSCDRFAGSRSS